MFGIGERLEQALREWKEPPEGRRDKKAFAAAMEARLGGRGGQKGVSYQSILSYFDGSSTPTLEWLHEAGDLLGVRSEWLVFGHGAAAAADEAIRREHEERAQEVGEREIADPLARAALEGLTETLPLQGHLASEYRCLVPVAMDLACAMAAIDRGAGEDSFREAGRLVGRSIAAPVEILAAAVPETDGRMARAYVSAAAHAVGILTDYAGRGTLRRGRTGK